MIASFFALASLVAIIPIFAVTQGLLATGFASAILAFALVMTAASMPTTDLLRLNRIAQPVLIGILLIPAAWMTIQALPTPVPALANDIWSTASSALKQRLSGAVSVDIGKTLLALARYASFVAAAIVTAGVALDRQRAATILFILAAVATVVATQQVLSELQLFSIDSSKEGEAIFVSAVGTLLSLTSAIHLYDRSQRSPRSLRMGATTLFGLSAAGAAFVICAAAVLAHGDVGLVVAVLTANGALAALFVIRRWRLGSWGKAGVAAAVAVALICSAALVAVNKADERTAAPASGSTATERMLADAPLAGSGAGAYDALLPIYRDATAINRQSPAGADVVAIEMGRVFVVAMLLASLAGAWLLFRRALERRQDYAFAGAGAAALAAAPVLIFVNGGMFGQGAALLCGVLFGLAFGQSLSANPRLYSDFTEQPAPAASPENLQQGAQLIAQPPADKLWPRLWLSALALILFAQSAWIIAAEVYSPGQRGYVADADLISVSRDRIQDAADIAAVRGDLWAESAWAQTSRRDGAFVVEFRDGAAAAAAIRDLKRAVRFAPHRSDAWLLLALLANRYKMPGFDARALLKMSYYTGPNDLALLPLRVNVALTADSTADDPDLRDMVQRDVKLALLRHPDLRAAVDTAYRSATPTQKRFADRLISEVDPNYLDAIRTP